MPINVQEKLREMSAQEKLIDQKKREVERKLAEQKKLIEKSIEQSEKKSKEQQQSKNNGSQLNSNSLSGCDKKPAFIGKMFNKNRFHFGKNQVTTHVNDSKSIDKDTFEPIEANDCHLACPQKIHINSNITANLNINNESEAKLSVVTPLPPSIPYPPPAMPFHTFQQQFCQQNYFMSPPPLPYMNNPYTNQQLSAPLPPTHTSSSFQQQQNIYNQPVKTQIQPPVPLMSLNTPKNNSFQINNSNYQIENTNNAQNKINNESQNEFKSLEAEYESFMCQTGQKNKDTKELYDPENASSSSDEDDENKKKSISRIDSLNINIKKMIEQAAQLVSINGNSYENELEKDFNNYWWFQAPSSDEYSYYKRCLDKELGDLKLENKDFQTEKPLNDAKSENDKSNDRKRKSRWTTPVEEKVNIKCEPVFTQNDDSNELPARSGFGFDVNVKKEEDIDDSDDFMKQMKEATERAKNIAEQLSAQMALYPEGYAASQQQMSIQQQKQYKEQKELQTIYETMMTKRREIESIAKEMKFKYEYDSDEEIDKKNGTWEHTLRKAEMEATKEWAIKLTEMSDEKHHIGDFIPPDELKKFMETYQALKDGRTPDLSDYKEFKLNAENVGYKLLQKLGWKEGQGLGKAGQGVMAPVNKGAQSVDHGGLGKEKPDNLSHNDDEFSMYRKRMMLAYKFRPNPLNNPRRPY